MEHKKLIDYSQPSPTKRTDKFLAVLWVVVMSSLAVALAVGLKMRGVW